MGADARRKPADRAGSPAWRALRGFGPVMGRLSHRAAARADPLREKKGTDGAVRRRALHWSLGNDARGRAPARGQKRVRMPVVSSSWLFEPNVDDTL